MMKTDKRRSFLIVLSLIFLANPNINLIDILPDCLAYILLLIVLRGAILEVPYAVECRDALKKLALFTAVKIPAFFVMYSNLRYGRDIIPLFTLIFSVIEVIYLCLLVNHCFNMLGYIGERTDASETIEPFSTSKSGKKKMTPAALKILTLIFVFSKAILNLIPELFLLTQEDYVLRLKLNDAYPSVLVSCFLIGLIPCIIWLRMALKYIKTLRCSETFASSVESFKPTEIPEAEKTKKKEKTLLNSLCALAVSSLFTFELTFEDFGNKNILPHFIYGIIILYSILRLTDNKKNKILLTIAAISFILVSAVTYILTSRFFEMYEQIDLKYSIKAQKEYFNIKTCAIIECVLVIFLLIVSAIIFAEFIKNNTGESPASPRYGIRQKKDHSRLVKKGLALFIIPIVINILKCANVFLKAIVKIAFTENKAEGFATSTLPWMGTVIFAICVIYTIYAFYYISEISTEVKFKYGQPN